MICLIKFVLIHVRTALIATTEGVEKFTEAMNSNFNFYFSGSLFGIILAKIVIVNIAKLLRSRKFPFSKNRNDSTTTW